MDNRDRTATMDRRRALLSGGKAAAGLAMVGVTMGAAARGAAAQGTAEPAEGAVE